MNSTSDQTQRPDLDGLEAAFKKATQGEWSIDGDDPRSDWSGKRWDGWRIMIDTTAVTEYCDEVQVARQGDPGTHYGDGQLEDARLIVALCNAAPALISEARRTRELEEALTPSGETKGAYIGEFSMPWPERDEDGNDVVRRINVPWTTIKEVMAAIRKRALSNTKETADAG